MKTIKEALKNEKKPIPMALKDLIKKRKPVKNIHQETLKKVTPMNMLALWITNKIGTMGFFLVIFLWSFLWLGWNFLAPKEWVFDPPMGFVFWLFISNLIQILLMPLIMVGQNIQGLHTELRAEQDLNVNLRAEHEIKVILENLEYQNGLILDILEHLKLNNNK